MTDTPLWITVDNPVENTSSGGSGSPPHAPPFQSQDLSLFCDEIASLWGTVQGLDVRVSALESEIVRLRNSTLTLAEHLERIRS